MQNTAGGLRPNRSAEWLPPNGLEVLWNPVNRRVNIDLKGALKVHGTCRENPRDFIGIRIIRCNTGDSPRGYGGRRATAAAGWTVESSQSEESAETATTVPLPGTVPAVANTGEMRWAVASQKRPLRP